MANSLWLGCAPDQDSHVRLKHNSVRRQRRRLLLLTCFGLGLLAHSPARASDDDIQSQRNEYAKACRDAIGPVRAFSCADGAVVPITVNGEPVDPTANQTCDRPALLDNGDQSDGQCVPNSRIVSLSTATAQVTAMCRQKKMRDASSMQFDEIDVVAHNPTTGATCWFQAVPQSGRPVEGASVPSPTDENVSAIWNDPKAIATGSERCGNCHDAGPTMYSPFVGQVWSVVRVDPFGPYFHVDPENRFGFHAWPTDALHPRDNACLGCHRIGIDQTCSQLTQWMSGLASPSGADDAAQRYPLSHGMPPPIGQTQTSWNNIYAASVAEIISCCKDPNQPECNRAKIAGAAPK